MADELEGATVEGDSIEGGTLEGDSLEGGTVEGDTEDEGTNDFVLHRSRFEVLSEPCESCSA